MTIILAITAIISLALGIACLRMASDAKTWRLRWMDLLGVLEMDMDRASRKLQEKQFSWMLCLLFALLVALSGSCGYWTFIEINEDKREKSTIERELEIGRAEVEKMRQRFGR